MQVLYHHITRIEKLLFTVGLLWNIFSFLHVSLTFYFVPRRSMLLHLFDCLNIFRQYSVSNMYITSQTFHRERESSILDSEINYPHYIAMNERQGSHLLLLNFEFLPAINRNLFVLLTKCHFSLLRFCSTFVKMFKFDMGNQQNVNLFSFWFAYFIDKYENHKQ